MLIYYIFDQINLLRVNFVLATFLGCEALHCIDFNRRHFSPVVQNSLARASVTINVLSETDHIVAIKSAGC